ncbi:MAG: hypothetical protein QW837_08565 [Conexivisphaerales archaeon]
MQNKSKNTSYKISIVVLIIIIIIGFSGMGYYYTAYTSNSSELSSLNKLDEYLTSRITYNGSNPSSLLQILSTPRIGIVDITAYEQAPILAAMNVTGEVTIDGFTYYVGTINGHPVVNVRAGEKDSSAEEATALMDNYFNISASILSGIGGSRNPYINTGDVVIGAFVVNKGSVHYYDGGYEDDYGGDEMVITNQSIIGSSLVTSYGEVGATPQDASTYGYGPGTNSTNYLYVADLAASAQLVKLASSYSGLGTTPISDITGNSTNTGSINAKVVVGVISSGGFWTEPVYLNAIQNALYQGDVGENEGWGFAFANAQYGIPWVIVRGISNSHFYPEPFHGVLASERAAQVAIYIVDNFNSSANLRTTATFSSLSAISEARIHGYIVANTVFFNSSGNITEVQYTNQSGQTVTIINPVEYPSQLPSLTNISSTS